MGSEMCIRDRLKQPQYVPMNVVDQVMSIYAGAKGYFDEVPVPKVADAEKDMLDFMKQEKSEVRDKLLDENALTDEINEMLASALKEWSERFVASLEKEPAAATA